MDTLCGRREQRLPACLCEAVAPVDLFAEQEEALVEEAYLVDRRAAHEHARAHHDLGLTLALVVEPARIEAVQELRPGASLRR